jgi:hypothetical protein
MSIHKSKLPSINTNTSGIAKIFNKHKVISGLTPRVQPNVSFVRYLELQYKLNVLNQMFSDQIAEFTTEEKFALLLPKNTIGHKRRGPGSKLQRNLKVSRIGGSTERTRYVSPSDDSSKRNQMNLSPRTMERGGRRRRNASAFITKHRRSLSSNEF